MAGKNTICPKCHSPKCHAYIYEYSAFWLIYKENIEYSSPFCSNLCLFRCYLTDKNIVTVEMNIFQFKFVEWKLAEKSTYSAIKTSAEKNILLRSCNHHGFFISHIFYCTEKVFTVIKSNTSTPTFSKAEYDKLNETTHILPTLLRST